MKLNTRRETSHLQVKNSYAGLLSVVSSQLFILGLKTALKRPGTQSLKMTKGQQPWEAHLL